MSTNVPGIVWVNGSPVLPTDSAILSGVQADIDGAFGGGVNQTLTTPQGQIAQSETAIISDKNAQIALVSNQVNPATASGQWQDALGYIYFINRIQAAGTVVNVTCTGAVGVDIPAGSVAQDTSGYLYSSTADAVIPAGGSISVQFQNQTPGAIACAIGSLNKIYVNIPGWDTISNPAVGALGNLVESRSAFETRRQQSVAGNSVNSIQAVQAAILALSGVIDAYTIDNPTNATIAIGSTAYPLAANSTLLSVAGGSASSIAQAFWSKKGAGSPYAPGNTSFVIYDETYNIPYPAYTISWLTPYSANVYFAIQIKNLPTLPSNIVSLVQSAVVQSFYGQDGGTKARINQTIFNGRFYANITALDPSVEILSLLIGFSALAATNTSLTFGIDQLPVMSAANVAVALV